MRLVDKLARTLLYEGYLLYPYRADAIKNRQRFTFGVLFPPDYCHRSQEADASSLQTECLVETTRHATLRVRVRFLHLLSREVESLRHEESAGSGVAETYEPVDALLVDGRTYHTWQEATEREVKLPELPLAKLVDQPYTEQFYFAASNQTESLQAADGRRVGQITRRHQDVNGTIVVSAEALPRGLCRVRVTVGNETLIVGPDCASREQALLGSLASAHTILDVEQGGFVSLLEPNEAHEVAAEACQNIGAWPVLVGEPPDRGTILSSPIILYDYPQVAPESPGDLCDGTEIDEILMLRIMTLTDEEKNAMRSLDPRSREMLDRTELLPQEQFMKMHGAIRGLRPVRETK